MGSPSLWSQTRPLPLPEKETVPRRRFDNRAVTDRFVIRFQSNGDCRFRQILPTIKRTGFRKLSATVITNLPASLISRSQKPVMKHLSLQTTTPCSKITTTETLLEPTLGEGLAFPTTRHREFRGLFLPALVCAPPPHIPHIILTRPVFSVFVSSHPPRSGCEQCNSLFSEGPSAN
jgi:hypothetical protein